MPPELLAFDGREAGLRAVKRYGGYPIMRYRTNDWIHSRRVAWLVDELIPSVYALWGDAFDAKKARLLAHVHDDAEIVMGDVQAGDKSKMTEEQLADVDRREREAIDAIAKRFPNELEGYGYRDLLLEVREKKTREATLLNWADKYDAFGEALHELYGGLNQWTHRIHNEYGEIPLPTEYYLAYFKRFTEKFAHGAELLKAGHPMLSIPNEPDIIAIAEAGKPHTAESVRERTGYLPYDFWREATLRRGTPEDIADLYTPKE